MKSHLFITVGLTLAVIFVFQAIDALKVSGIGRSELYVLGGLILAFLLVRQGLKEHFVMK